MRKLPPQSQSLALEQKEVLATVSTAVSSAPASTQLSTGPTRTWRNRLRGSRGTQDLCYGFHAHTWGQTL